MSFDSVFHSMSVVPPSDESITQSDVPSSREVFAQLGALQQVHPFWDSRFFRACKAGHLTADDFRFVFGQYSLYVQNFTRCLAGLMANCDNDLLRARLSESVWRESGDSETETHPVETFRRFLKDGLAIDVNQIDYLEATKSFVREYIDFCGRSHPAACGAFLAFGTKAIESRLNETLLEGLVHAGLEERNLEFFRKYTAIENPYTATIEGIMVSYAQQPKWFHVCRQAMDYALNLRRRFFDCLYDGLRYRRVRVTLDRIQTKKSLAAEVPEASSLVYNPGAVRAGVELYRNVVEKLNIDFTVDRLPFGCEVLDPRVVRIPPGKYNERHKHAHETIFCIVKGHGRIQVNETLIDAKPGDVVFVPRWATHQSQNHSDEEMVILAITDFGLTGKAFVGDYHRTARMQKNDYDPEGTRNAAEGSSRSNGSNGALGHTATANAGTTPAS